MAIGLHDRAQSARPDVDVHDLSSLGLLVQVADDLARLAAFHETLPSLLGEAGDEYTGVLDFQSLDVEARLLPMTDLT